MTVPADYDVTIMVNSVDVTTYVPYSSMSFEDYARQVSRFNFRIENPSGITPAKNQEVIITENTGNTTIFRGLIIQLKERKRDNGITMIYECECADRKIYLQKAILGYNEFTGADSTILGNLLSNAYPDLSSLLDFSSDIAGFADNLDFLIDDGTTLLDALNNLADLTDADWHFEEQDSSLYGIVTFDVGGYSDYSVSDTGMTSGENAVGNPGNAAQGTAPSDSTGQRLTVEINLATSENIWDFTADYFADITGQSTTSWDIAIRDGGPTGTIRKISTLDSDIDANGNWTSRSGSDATFFTWTPPYLGDYIRLQIRSSNTHTGADLRLDNIQILTGDGTKDNLQWDDSPPPADFDIDVQSGDQYASDIDLDTGSFDDLYSITVIGGYEEVSVDWIYDNDGSRDHLDLELAISDLVIYTNGGTDTTPSWGSALTLGAWGPDTLVGDGGSADVLYDSDNHWLLFDSAPPNLVNSWRITGTIQRPIRVRVENVADGDPTFATTYQNDKITSVDEAVAVAQAQLTKKNAITQLTFKTYEPGLKPGQSISVADSARGLSETVTIRQINTTWIGANKAQFEIQCGDDDVTGIDAIVANADKRTRVGGVNTTPNTQTAYLLTDDSGVFMTDDSYNQLYYIA